VLHLRVLCPTERSEQVRRLLFDEPGATHLTVLPGVAVQPPGDVVEAALTRECADRVLDGLTDLGVQHSGGITLEPLDTVLSDAADAAEAAVPGDPADAVIWDELIGRTGEDSRLTVSFLAFLTIACLLAGIGAITNSSVTVVGGASWSGRPPSRCWSASRWPWWSPRWSGRCSTSAACSTAGSSTT
jgi:hypothetical protein